MNAAQYLLTKMRNCKPSTHPHGDNNNKVKRRTNKTAATPAASCAFASVGSASHNYHGDDAVGYGPGYMVVADGVSGTLKSSGVLAKILVAETLASLGKLKKKLRGEPIQPEGFHRSMQQAINTARKHTKRKGRLDSTLSAVYFCELTRTMYVFTIGDCKCVLLRDGKVVFESDSIVYDFNVPAVVSNNDAVNYSADEITIQRCGYEPQDVCMVFSDGVHDNLFVDQIVENVELCGAFQESNPAQDISKKLMETARDTFTNSDDFIPFAVSAAGFCLEAMEEIAASSNGNKEEFLVFKEKCEDLPASKVTRAFFGKELRVRKLAFYSATTLLAFAQKQIGKKDDISVCTALLA